MAEEQAQLEMEMEADTEVEVESPEQETESEKVEVVQEDQFEKAESSTQKRIDRLTKKMREAQRREEEAINYAKQVQEEATKLKERFSALDSNYVTEYSNRVSTQMEQTEKELARAMELGDTSAVVEANKKMIALSAENERANQAKLAQERQQQQAEQQQAAPQQMQAAPQQQIKRPDPKAQDWAARNEWFGQDEAKTFAAFGIHKKLVEDEGFDPTSDEYYTELDRRISDTFGGEAKSASKRPAQTVAGVSRSNSGRSSGKKVRLTPSQVAIAKKLGVPLEEYAKYVKE
jgi:hypothetical protein|tara:strand:- start:70 stop:939 length:870 start_codon:yes stop_codon:yes gene_type:complete